MVFSWNNNLVQAIIMNAKKGVTGTRNRVSGAGAGGKVVNRK